MEPLKTINLEGINKNSLSGWKYRTATRAVVFDEGDKIGLLHVTHKNYYKLPGGGIEKGEDMRTALYRECQEELGVGIEIQQEIGSIVEYRGEYKLHQISYCFLAEINSEKKPPAFTDKEKLAGFKIIWAKPSDALEFLNLKQTTDYEGKFVEERDSCFLEKALRIKNLTYKF